MTQLLGIDDAAIREVRNLLERTPSFVPITVKDRVTWEEVSRVALNSPVLPGVQPEMVLSRFYPFGPDFAHQVGYVGPVSDNDLAAGEDAAEPLLRLPDYQIGKVGIERRFERDLRGSPGAQRVEVNAGGRTMRELALEPPVPGHRICRSPLTITCRTSCGFASKGRAPPLL